MSDAEQELVEPMRLGETVRRRRIERGLTVAQLAEWCDVSEDTIVTLELGTGPPGVEPLGRVAEALGYPSALALMMDAAAGAAGAPPAVDAQSSTADVAQAFLRGRPDAT